MSMQDSTPPIYSKGLKGIVANETSLSDVRGEEGRLLYCGYDIEDLVDLCSYGEIIYLLLNRRLPNRQELDGLRQRLRHDRELPQPILDFFKSATKTARPMSALRTAVSMLGMYDDRTKDPSQMKEIGLSLIAKLPVMAAYYHRICQGLELPPSARIWMRPPTSSGSSKAKNPTRRRPISWMSPTSSTPTTA